MIALRAALVCVLVGCVGVSTAAGQGAMGQAHTAACLALEAAGISLGGPGPKPIGTGISSAFGTKESRPSGADLNAPFQRAAAKLNAIFDGQGGGAANCNINLLYPDERAKVKAAIPSVQQAVAAKVKALETKLAEIDARIEAAKKDAETAGNNARRVALARRQADGIVQACGPECRQSPEVAERLASIDAQRERWNNTVIEKAREQKKDEDEKTSVQIGIRDLQAVQGQVTALDSAL
ncbi:MAG: hypothetical protein HY216_17975 [Candidatus Rokubacteria bacterium]|nr:hypothetical protein [Candidatus Rokubacteria bacterium]